MRAKLRQQFTERIYNSNYRILYTIGARMLLLRNNIKYSGYKIRAAKVDIKVLRNKTIPKLAWKYEVEASSAKLSIGGGVEVTGWGVCEAVWDDKFENPPKRTEALFGSAVITESKHAVFVPGKHSLEALFVLYDNKSHKTLVSNSLAYLMSSAKINTKSDFFRAFEKIKHDSAVEAVERGVDRYERLVLSTERYTPYRMMYYNFSVDSLGRIKSYWNPLGTRFYSYDDYKEYLSKKTRDLFDNAVSAKRKRAKYNLMATISKGYDSTAAAVIARENGCQDALTLGVTVYDYNDSGAENGNRLGITVHERGHVLTSDIENLNIAFNEKQQKLAHEFIATDGIGDDVAFLAFEDKIEDSLYLYGAYGDILWRRTPRVPAGMTKQIFEKSLTEFRLRVGFVACPLISLGSRYSADIYRITNSEELADYRVGGKYDRPIPRKIGEDAGLERMHFGVQRSASSPLILNQREFFSEAMNEVMGRYK